jgi:hypothetical protein
MRKKQTSFVIKTLSRLSQWDKDAEIMIFHAYNFKTTSSETLCSKFETFTGLRLLALIKYCGEENISGVLEVLKKVENLSIEHSYIGDHRIEKFARSLVCMTSLTCISMMNMNLGDEQFACISRALANMPNMKNVHMRFNRISDKGAIAFAESLKSHCRLEALDLSYNNIGNEGALAIAESMKPLLRFSIFYFNNNCFDDNVRKSIMYSALQCCSLYTLALNKNTFSIEKTFRVFRERYIKLAMLRPAWNIKTAPFLLICNKVLRK